MAVANDLAMTLVITLMLMGLNVVGDFVVDGGLKKHLGSLSQGGLKGVLADVLAPSWRRIDANSVGWLVVFIGVQLFGNG